MYSDSVFISHFSDTNSDCCVDCQYALASVLCRAAGGENITCDADTYCLYPLYIYTFNYGIHLQIEYWAIFSNVFMVKHRSRSD